jgi:predicted  nucleic acid-binding Zn-ribbon protein
MDRTVRALTDLSAVDDQLSRKEALMDRTLLALEAQRAALRDAIPRVFLAAYDALGRMGRRPVVVEVRGAHCSGCYLRFPPQLGSCIRRRQSLCPCPHCRRLLYMPPLTQESEISDASKHKLRSRLAAAGPRSGCAGLPADDRLAKDPTLPRDGQS